MSEATTYLKAKVKFWADAFTDASERLRITEEELAIETAARVVAEEENRRLRELLLAKMTEEAA